MALVNPNIAMGVKPMEAVYQPRSPLADYAQMMQIQNAQQQNALSQYQLSAAQRADQQATERLNALRAAENNPDQIYNALIRSGDVKGASEFLKSKNEARAADLKRAGDMADLTGRLLFDVKDENSWQAVRPRLAQLGGDASKLPLNYDPAFVASEMALAQTVKDRIDRSKLEIKDLPLKAGQNLIVGINPYTGEQQPITQYDARDPHLYSPEAQRQRLESSAAGAARSTTLVNTQLPASEEAQKEYMKEARQTFSALKQAPTVLENIEAAKKLIPQARGFLGAGGQPLLQVASFLNNRLGTAIDVKGVESAEELRSRLFLGIMDNLKKLDSQPSQPQQEALQIALGSVGTDPGALPRVLDVFGDTIRNKVELYNEEVAGAEGRGVKFPYNPQIKLPSRKAPPEAQIPTQAPATPATPASKTVVRTGTLNGRRVVQYSDGSTSYAD